MTKVSSRLKFVARFGYGDALPPEKVPPGGVSVFGSNGPFTTTYLSNTTAPVIIIGRKGSYGKINWSSEECFASDTTFFIDKTKTNNDLRWLFYALQTLKLDEGSNEAAVPGLNREVAYNLKICVPDIAYQRCIAKFLDSETARIDALVEAKEHLLNLLAEKRIALITRTVTHGLDSNIKMKDSGVEWLGEVPEHWEVSRLRWLYSKIEQGWSPQSEGIEPGEKEWGVLKLNAVKTGKFDDTKCKALPVDSIIPTNLEVKPGDFLITRANTPSLVGDVCYVEKTRSKLILSDLIYRLHLDNEKVDGEFLNFFLLTVGRVQIEADARGTSNSMVKISQEHIANWIVALPPREEQLAIVEFIGKVISKLDALRTANIRSIELLKERRAALISAAVTGQIEITD